MFWKKSTAALIICILFTGCKAGSEAAAEYSDSNAESIPTEEIPVETLITEPPPPEYSDSDKMVIDWFLSGITDSEEFPDINDYRYYARTLGLDMDYFLDPQMWEVYYNEALNINKDVDEKEYYLIRLDPYKLLDVYSQRCETDRDSLCEKLSVTAPQLYYNFGYNPAAVNYGSNHEENLVAYSETEREIFGGYNGEAREKVMQTHLLVIDRAEDVCSYQSSVTDAMKIKRRDDLKAFSEEKPFYSAYTAEEKSPAFTVNGIGIRTVIPLTMPNAHSGADGADREMTVMVNVSPYSYGCTDEDIIDIMPYIKEQSENKK